MRNPTQRALSCSSSFVLVLASIAGTGCGSSVEQLTSGSGAGGAGGETSSTMSTSSATTTAATTGAGGAGGGPVKPIQAGPLGAPTCGAIEEAAVISTNPDHTWVVTTDIDGSWGTPQDFGPGETAAAFPTGSGVGVFWATGEGAFSMEIHAGEMQTPVAQTDWPIEGNSPTQAVNQRLLVSNWYQPHRVSLLGYDHPNLYAPIEGADDTFLRNISVAPDGDGFTAVGAGPDSTLCDVHFDGDNSWGAPHCRADILIPSGGEIPFNPPEVVQLGNGDLGVVYPMSTEGYNVTFRKSGVWTDPISIDVGYYDDLAFASGPNRNVLDGLAIVSVVDSNLIAIEVSESKGWSTPIIFDTPAPDQGRNVAISRGMCGDDVEITYGDSEGLKVARVKGTDAAIDVVVPDDGFAYLYGLAIVTQYLPLG